MRTGGSVKNKNIFFSVGALMIVGAILYAVPRCCSIIVPRPNSSITQYIITDRWAYCLGRGLPSVWIASTETAFRWWQLAERNGHCVDVYGI